MSQQDNGEQKEVIIINEIILVIFLVREIENKIKFFLIRFDFILKRVCFNLI